MAVSSASSTSASSTVGSISPIPSRASARAFVAASGVWPLNVTSARSPDARPAASASAASSGSGPVTFSVASQAESRPARTTVVSAAIRGAPMPRFYQPR